MAVPASINAGSIYLTLEAKSKAFFADMGKADRAYSSTTGASDRAQLRINANEGEIGRIRGSAITQYRRLTDEEKKRIRALEEENSEIGKGRDALKGTGQAANTAGKQFNFMAVAGIGAIVGLVAASGTGSAAIESATAVATGFIDTTLEGYEEMPEKIQNIGGAFNDVKQDLLAGDNEGLKKSGGDMVTSLIEGIRSSPIHSQVEYIGQSLGVDTDSMYAQGEASARQMVVGLVDGMVGIDTWLDDTGRTLQVGWDGMVTGASKAGGDIIGAIGGAGQAAQDDWNTASTNVTTYLTDLGSTAVTEGLKFADSLGLDDLNRNVQDFVDNPGKEITEWANGLGDALAGAGKRAGEFWDALQKESGKASKGAEDAWNSFWGKK